MGKICMQTNGELTNFQASGIIYFPFDVQHYFYLFMLVFWMLSKKIIDIYNNCILKKTIKIFNYQIVAPRCQDKGFLFKGSPLEIDNL
jgi:hypothetical protein